MILISKYKKEILIGIGLIILYFVTRLILLSQLPIFTDEAIYVRWTQIAANDANWRFISLTDGKQPMLIWFGMPLVKILNDSLVAIRLISVMAGFFSLIGLWFLSLELFKDRRVAFLTVLLYIVYPFAVVYDRMALYDSLVGAFAIWAIYFSVLLVRRVRLDIAYTLGLIIGGGMLTKTNANFSIIMLPFTLLLFNFKRKEWMKILLKWALFAFFAVLIAELSYNFLRLSPFFHIIKEKNATFVYYPFSIPIDQNIKLFLGNLKGLAGWIFVYLTPFYIFLIITGLISKKFIRENLLLVLYFLAPFMALALFGKIIFPRHIFFMTLYLLPIAAYGLIQIIDYINKFFKGRRMNMSHLMGGLTILFFILYPAKVSLDFIFNPSRSGIAQSDKNQYISDWPAGGGVRESVDYFNEVSQNQKIFIGTEGTFGLMPASLEIYLGKNSNIMTKGYWPVEAEIPKDVLNSAARMPTYFVFYQPCESCEFSGDAPKSWPLTLVKRIKKSDNTYFSIYRVNN